MTREKTGGQLLVEALDAQGVQKIFGIPGVQLDEATDALYAVADRIGFVCTRNEQATTYMADGYARSTGDVGVAMVVPGPGVLNALSGLATAYATSSRVLLLAGQIESRMIGKGYGALHELPDQTGILERLTKWTGIARRPEDIPGLVARAFEELRSGRPQPVALELPPDVLAATGSSAVQPRAVGQRLVPDPSDIELIAQLLVKSRRPLIYVGGGVLAADASGALVALAEALDAPVVVSENGRGAIDARHDLAFDAIALRAFREDADLVLGVGTRFMTSFGQPVDVRGADVVLVNADESALGPPRSAKFALCADADLTLQALVGAVGRPTRESRNTEFANVRRWVATSLLDVAPQREYLSAIRSALPDDGVLVNEYTQVGYVAGICFPTYHSRGYIGPGYQGTLGYGFATSLGVKVASPQRAVLSVNGDGGFAWTMQELSTLRQHNLGVVTLIFNDGHFGNVRRIQKTRYGARYFASDLTNPEYCQLASAYGLPYAKAQTPAELGSVLKDAFAADEPVLVEAPVGEFPSPWPLIHERQPGPLPSNAHQRSDQ